MTNEQDTGEHLDVAIEWCDLITPHGFARVCSYCRSRSMVTSDELAARIEAVRKARGTEL